MLGLGFLTGGILLHIPVMSELLKSCDSVTSDFKPWVTLANLVVLAQGPGVTVMPGDPD